MFQFPEETTSQTFISKQVFSWCLLNLGNSGNDIIELFVF